MQPRANTMTAKAKILYVEDDYLNMELIRRMLTRWGYEMIESDSALDVIAIVEKELPDLILMDMHLPEVSGIELVYELKARDDLKHIPIVALTADTLIYKACKLAGCEGFLNKPVSQGALQRTIEEHLT